MFFMYANHNIAAENYDHFAAACLAINEFSAAVVIACTSDAIRDFAD